jgi:quercetin dioxygenase-like cupin family protein
MKHRSLLISLVLCLLPNLSVAQSPSGSVENRTGATVSSRFAATFTTPPTERGAAQSFEVSLGSLSLRGGRRIEAPPMGYYLATLIAGEVITSIAGAETQRHPGDTWAVNAGEAMTVQLQGKSKEALLQIFTVKEASPPK